MRVGAAYEGPINVATGETVPIRRVVEILSADSGVADVRWDATKPDGQLERSYNVDKLRSLGFVPKTSIEQGLAQTLNWYTENYPNVRA